MRPPLSVSLIAYLLCAGLLIGAGLIYYPKWKYPLTEATISWDVSGYYYYLPAFLIYRDAKALEWHDDILRRYHPAPGDQAYPYAGGNKVMKYSAGLALQYLPFFLIAHALAPVTDHPADGFSRPYQLAISLGSLLIACVGLWLLRILLRRRFGDTTVAVTLLTIVFATNYLDYAGINHAMPHNYLFMWYVVLILLCEAYWKRPGGRWALAIGLTTGLMTLTRPSEIIAVLLPLFWGIYSAGTLHARVRHFEVHWRHLVLAATGFCIFGLIQIIYWRYATGEWTVYSYQDQGFNWLSPHFTNGMFSYRAGWLVYSPVMVFSLTGFYFLWQRSRALFFPLIVFTILFMYITWSWDIWWYGGSLGQRSMVQLTAVLAFPLAAFVDKVRKSHRWKPVAISVLLMCIYYNLWLTHQAHHGGLIQAGQMTRSYFWHILGRYTLPDEHAIFRLDSRHWYRGNDAGTRIFKQEELKENVPSCDLPNAIDPDAICITGRSEIVDVFSSDLAATQWQWFRGSAVFYATDKEWDTWKMARFRISLKNTDRVVRSNEIRVFRALEPGEARRLYVDLKVPTGMTYDAITIDFLNADSDVPLYAWQLEIVGFP